MSKIILAVLVIFLAVGLIAIVFTFNQANGEQQRLALDLQYRSDLLARSLRETVEPNFINRSNTYLQTLVEKFANRERFAGMAIYDNKDNVIAVSSNLPKEISDSQQIVTDAMDADKANGDFATLKNKNYYLFAIPLHDQDSVVGAIMIVQNAGYIDTRVAEIWKDNLTRLFLQSSLLTIAVLLLIRWLIFAPVRRLAESLKSARTGVNDGNKPSSASLFFQPLTQEISSIQRSLLEARLAASEEAKVYLERLDSPWTAERLRQFVKNTLQDRKIIVVSNREPYIHTKVGNKISYYFPASGMATAIEPVMEACGGTWVAHGSGDADRLTVDKKNHIAVPPEEPKYTLRRLWLNDEEQQGYYVGFCNECLWPLTHFTHVRPTFRQEDWEQYKNVNKKFAATILSEIKNIRKPIILVQDFHVALVPLLIKKSRPDATIGLFWHEPWVNAEGFSIFPWKKEFLEGMLGADLIGFHTQLHCNNFIDTVGHELESLIDYERFTVTRDEHITFVKPFPIGIAFANGYETPPENKEDKANNEKLLKNLGVHTKYIGLGVERLDYIKGILERLKAIEVFLRRNPTYQEHFTYIQIAAPSRSHVKRYRQFAQEVENEVERVNTLFRTRKWKPIVLVEKHHSHEELNRLYKLTNICLVTSLHDGMNLVAKEFIAARADGKGVLILSQFTGASKELKDALIVNPYNADQTAETIHTALQMTPYEQMKRMKKLRRSVRNYNTYRWSAEILKTLASFE